MKKHFTFKRFKELQQKVQVCFRFRVSFKHSFSPSLVLASEQQTEVKQYPKKEPKSYRDKQAIPFAQLSNSLQPENIITSGQTRRARNRRP
jgi:hypothetical protein